MHQKKINTPIAVNTILSISHWQNVSWKDCIETEYNDEKLFASASETISLIHPTYCLLLVQRHGVLGMWWGMSK